MYLFKLIALEFSCMIIVVDDGRYINKSNKNVFEDFKKRIKDSST